MPRRPLTLRPVATAAALLALLVAAYANHFGNGFHFDDDHTIVNNVFVRDARNIPRFFVDATTSSVLPSNRSYRPILQATLAVDYWIGGGYRPVVFQIDSFLWFVLTLAAMWWLFAIIIDRAGGDRAFAIVPTAVYAVHPAGAETVNYIIQRGEIISTAGVVAALAMYAAWPSRRRWGLYLVPLTVGILAKPPAMIFPALLFAYVYLLEPPPAGRAPGAAVRAAVPSLALVGMLAVWTVRHTPPTFAAGGGAPLSYWLTQPFVSLRYFTTFFAPIALSADNDWRRVATLADFQALAGIAFVAALAWAIARTARRAEMRPVAFGLVWFIVALAPTALVPLAEVGNDHRMFFPFVGLTLAVCWAVAQWWRTRSAAAGLRHAGALAVAAVLTLEAVGVHVRNEVWRSDASLWLDVTRKSPTNGRGLMNYGLTRMAQGDFREAIAYFERARAYTPEYSLLHINLGLAYGGAGRIAEADREFNEAIALAPTDWRSHYYYGRWLRQIRRSDDALAQLELAVEQNPADLDAARELEAARGVPAATTPAALLERSVAAYRAGQFRECIDLARLALARQPGYAEAYNNLAAGFIGLGQWDDGIAAAEDALRLNPDLVSARNNLAYARRQKQQSRR